MCGAACALVGEAKATSGAVNALRGDCPEAYRVVIVCVVRLNTSVGQQVLRGVLTLAQGAVVHAENVTGHHRDGHVANENVVAVGFGVVASHIVYSIRLFVDVYKGKAWNTGCQPFSHTNFKSNIKAPAGILAGASIVRGLGVSVPPPIPYALPWP